MGCPQVALPGNQVEVNKREKFFPNFSDTAAANYGAGASIRAASRAGYKKLAQVLQ